MYMQLRVIKTIGLATGLVLLPAAALAVTASPAPSSSPSVLSDYARDVLAGQQQLAADPVAQQIHNDVNKAEDQAGEVDSQKQELDTHVDVNEATKDNSDESAQKDESKTDSGSKSDYNDSKSGSDSKAGSGSND
ncbi:MAG: hypothetical protein NVS3B29_08120 [Candidatus Saccharimonadales bacterium]